MVSGEWRIQKMPVYRGFRGQEQTGIRLTEGIFASEGEGVYISLDKGLAKDFAHSGGYIQELEFSLSKPLIVRTEISYILHEADELEELVEDSDSDWLKANKIACQRAMKAMNGNWSKARNLMGRILTDVLREMGYDGVIIDQGRNNRWAVVFDPGNVKVVGVKRRAHLNREVRLARELVRSRGIDP
jgi:hypothetical protein